ncbi:hypothetical protein WME89_40910 [Sorangium sp. So ce321]|uniref:hypothetical protein n=1 Tax=Sorangium sp. So ce321 TaxID=3133300 RepID=UPI003F60491D
MRPAYHISTRDARASRRRRDSIRRRQREALTRSLIDQLDPKYRDLLVKRELEKLLLRARRSL